MAIQISKYFQILEFGDLPELGPTDKLSREYSQTFAQ